MVEETAAETKHLRACINNLMGLVALPAIWSGSSPTEVVRTLVDMLVGMLRLDFVYLQLKHSAGEQAIEAVRCPDSNDTTALLRDIRDLLTTRSSGHLQEWPRVVRRVLQDKEIAIVRLPLGLEAEVGMLVAGCRRADFPAQTEKLLLSVAANQVAVWFQGAQLLGEHKRVAEQLDRRVAERTEELAASNSELRKQIAKEQSISLENTRLYRDLEDRERRIRRLVDANVIGIVIWDLDGRLIDANDAFLRMLRYEREDLQAGLRWFDMTPPEWQEAHARYEAEELKATGMMQPREKEYFRKDGSRVPVLIGAACFEGQSNQGVAYILDLTEQKRAEEALRSSQDYLMEAQTLTHTGSCAIDGRSREIVYWSAEMFRLFGFDPEQGLPKWDDWVQRIHPEDRDKFGMAGEKTFREKAHCDVEFRIVKPDGAIRYIHGIGHPVLSPGGELVQVVGTMVDVTERKSAEEAGDRLRQLQADLAHINRVSTMGELTASLAHEIKQPIGAAVTNAEACIRFIDRKEPDLPEAREAAVEMVKDVRRAADIIDRVRLLYQRGSSRLEAVDLNQLIQEMVSMMGVEANRQAVDIRTYLTQEVPRVMADRVQLQQALMNLMSNGIEAMHAEGGELRIQSRFSANGQLLISVSDTGIGFPPENADKIFNAFFTTKARGTGLGLAITRSVIQSHGGRIWAAANPGGGATFTFTLPISEAAAA